ncbi:MAG: hypothetical protein ACKO0V_02260 [bacterium]
MATGIKAALVVEGANNPTFPEADDILRPQERSGYWPLPPPGRP